MQLNIIMNSTLKIFALVAITIFLGCNTHQENPQSSDAALEKSFTENNINPSEDNPNKSIERKIIKEGSISFESSDVKATKSLISKTLSELHGYYADDNIYDYEDKTEYAVTIRIPANMFDSLLDRISQNAKKIDSKNINTLDATEEFIDIEARLRNKKELENRYKELIKQARGVDEILSIEKEINTLRSDIDAMEGRLKYLTDRVAYSTLNVTFYEKKIPEFGFGSKVVSGIVNSWSNLLWFLIGLINLWPFMILIGGTIFIYKRYRRKHKKITKTNN